MDEVVYNQLKDRLSNRGQTAPPVARKEPTQKEIDELFRDRITTKTDLPPMQPLFSMFNVPCFYRGELAAVCGKAKSGKTTFLSILMTACLMQKALALERLTEIKGHTDPADLTDLKPLRVLWVDTEQSQQSTQAILKERIMALAGFGREGNADDADVSGMAKIEEVIDTQLFAFNLRGHGYKDRGRKVDVALRCIKPDIAVIDGIKDLMTDINDSVQSTMLMEKLLALAKDTKCCIVCVLHQNKSEQDNNMRGSIGTELTNKAFEVFQCKSVENPDCIKVAHTYSRGRRMKQKLCFQFNDDGMPEACENSQEQPRDSQGRWVSKDTGDTSSADLHKLFSDAMEGRTQRPFKEVMAIALKKCGVADAKAYYALVEQAVSHGTIRLTEQEETGITWVELLDGQLPF